jgi:agmatine deiminase
MPKHHKRSSAFQNQKRETQPPTPMPQHLDRYRMPAEWEFHEATWIGWPHNLSDWPGKFAPIPWVYGEIVRHIVRGEIVRVLVNSRAHENQARKILKRVGVDLARVEFFRFQTDRGWTRDFGPIFLRRESRKGGLAPVAATLWRFNAWAKYSDWKLDTLAGAEIATALKVPAWQPELRHNGELRRIVLEGGSIDVNGRGTLITTEECLLSDLQQRNPGLSREHLEELFADYLGIEKVIWLERGIVGDDTHGHVDDITRFVGPRTVVTAYEPDPDDPNHEPLLENFRWLKKSTDQSGKSLKVLKLPMPKPVWFEGQRLPASYANFHIANKLVLVPVFGDANDRVALDVLAGAFPDREVVGVYCRDFIWGLGALHCMTQPQPAA